MSDTITLAAETTRLPLLTRPLPVFRTFLADYPTFTITTTMLWRSEMIYLARSSSGAPAHLYEYTGHTVSLLWQS